MITVADDRVICDKCHRPIIVRQYEDTGQRWWVEPCIGPEGPRHKLSDRVKCPHGKLRENCLKCIHAPARV